MPSMGKARASRDQLDVEMPSMLEGSAGKPGHAVRKNVMKTVSVFVLLLTSCLDLNPGNYIFSNDPPVCAADCVAQAAACRDAQTLLVHRVRACDADVCQREAVAVDCVDGCVNGACVGEPCAGIFCSTPPPAQCIGSLLRTSTAVGTCEAAQCSYQTVDFVCTSGCENGHCIDEPCTGKLCITPPPSVCIADSTLRVSVSAGRCIGNGSCEYLFVDIKCAGACSQGVCVGDSCAGNLCERPPAASCKNSTVLHTSEARGACVSGVCEYDTFDQVCMEGLQCVAGACTGTIGAGGGSNASGGGGGSGATGGGRGGSDGDAGGGSGNVGGGTGGAGGGGSLGLTGDVCATAETITAGMVFGDMDNYSNDYVSSECGLSSVNDRVYRLTVPAGQRVRVKTKSVSGALFMAQDCSPQPTRCLSKTANFNSGWLTWHNSSEIDVDVLLIVESSGFIFVSTSFSLSVVFDLPPPGDVCTNAIPLTLGVPLINQDTRDFVIDYNFQNIDRAWSVEIPAGHTLKVAATPVATGSLTMMVAGSPLACSVGPRAESSSSVSRLAVITRNNPTTVPVPTYVGVSAATTAPFDILATSTPIAPGDRCENAVVLSPGTTSVSMDGLVADYKTEGKCWRSEATDRIYRFSVPPNIRATITTSIDTDPLLFPAQICEEMLPTCLSKADNTYSTWFNQSSTVEEVMVWVGAASDAQFDLTLSLTPAPIGDTCSNAIVISGSVNLSAQTFGGFAGDSDCAGDLNLPDRIYRLDIPPGYKVTLDATANAGTVDIALTEAVPEVCAIDETLCDRRLSSEGTISNRGPFSESVYAVIKGNPPVTSMTVVADYQAVSLAPEGDICQTAPLITPGTLSLQSMSFLSRDYGGSSSPDRVFAIDVPGGRDLFVYAVSREVGQKIDAISLYDGPAITCGWSSKGSFPGTESEPKMYINQHKGTSKRVFIVVQTAATFDLVTSIR